MRGFLLALLLLAVAAAGIWWWAPEWIPAEWRAALKRDPRDDPASREYAPVVYRWRDADGVLHVTDKPPGDRDYEQVRIDPDTNIVPSTLPVGHELPADSGDRPR